MSSATQQLEKQEIQMFCNKKSRCSVSIGYMYTSQCTKYKCTYICCAEGSSLEYGLSAFLVLFCDTFLFFLSTVYVYFARTQESPRLFLCHTCAGSVCNGWAVFPQDDERLAQLVRVRDCKFRVWGGQFDSVKNSKNRKLKSTRIWATLTLKQGTKLLLQVIKEVISHPALMMTQIGGKSSQRDFFDRTFAFGKGEEDR